MFRRVDLPARLPGRLLLHSMPGRFEAIEMFWHELKSEAVSAIVCLTEAYEIRPKSSKYAEALETGTVPCSVLPFGVREGGVPEDRDAFWALANDIANRLQSGEAVLIHCAGGIGRTAMLAVSVLLALGEPMNEAESAVSRAGSTVETMPQMEMLSWCTTRRTSGRCSRNSMGVARREVEVRDNSRSSVPNPSKITKEVAVKKLAVTMLLAALSLGLPAVGFSQAPFYEGKTINVVYGGGPGGTVDLRFRATASVFRKHIPGRPTLTIEYMPGGGSRKAGNHLYRARPDGLTMGVMLSSFVPAAVLGSTGVLYDIDKLIYLGSPTSGEPYIFLSRKEAGLNNLDKLRSASGVRIGAQSVGHNLYNIGRILAYLAGMKDPKFVTGFAQGNEVNLALMQGELDARWTIQATLVREAPEWIEKKLTDFHVVIEVPKGRRHPHPVFAGLPDIERLAKSEKDRKLLNMHRAFVSAGTPFILPPGTPADKVQILREAMRKTFNDPEFYAEFKKLVGEEPTPLMPEELEKAVRELPRDREIVELFNKLSGAEPLPPRT